MNITVAQDKFFNQLKNFKPQKYEISRALSLYSAAITLADDDAITRTIEIGRSYAIEREMFYEIVLQSYLFLGFPRMLTAAENLGKSFPSKKNKYDLKKITDSESRQWFDDGLGLYQKVYGDKHRILQDKVMSMAPEVFRWMIIEGYGKVLSRPVIDITNRELSIIAFLMMENRKKQLLSHIVGAGNVNVSMELINYVVDDIGEAAGDGYQTARAIIKQLVIS